MSLKGGELWYHETEGDDAKVLGIVNIQDCEQIVNGAVQDLGVKKEFAFAIQTRDAAKKEGKAGKARTYFMSCESQGECDDWVETLNSIGGKTDEEIREMMMTARVDPRNAQGTIEADEITSVTADEKTDAEGNQVFIVMTQNRVEKFIAANADDMDDWIRVLKPTAHADEDEDEDESGAIEDNNERTQWSSDEDALEAEDGIYDSATLSSNKANADQKESEKKKENKKGGGGTKPPLSKV